MKAAHGAWIRSPLLSWAYFPLGLEDCVCLSRGGVGAEITARAALGRGSGLWVAFLDHMGKLWKMLRALHCARWTSISLSIWCLHKIPSTGALLHHPAPPTLPETCSVEFSGGWLARVLPKNVQQVSLAGFPLVWNNKSPGQSLWIYFCFINIIYYVFY